MHILTVQDLRNGLVAIEKLTISAKDAGAVAALMERYRMEIAAIEEAERVTPAAPRLLEKTETATP